VVAPEGADVELAGVALEVLILEEAEPAAADRGALRVVNDLRLRRAGAAKNVLLFVAADLGVDVPVRTENAGITADVVIAADFLGAEERARRSGDVEKRTLER
jgi:hypothetical protein